MTRKTAYYGTNWPPPGEHPPTHKGACRYIADQTGLDVRQARDALNAFVQFLHQSVVQNEERVAIWHLGAFVPRYGPSQVTMHFRRAREQEKSRDG